MKNVEYNAEIDSLSMYKEGKRDVFGSVTIGNFIIDVDNQGKIISLEIDNASEILGITQKKLQEIEDAKINIVCQNNVVMVRYQINFKKTTSIHTGSIIIPQQKLSAKILA